MTLSRSRHLICLMNHGKNLLNVALLFDTHVQSAFGKGINNELPYGNSYLPAGMPIDAASRAPCASGTQQSLDIEFEW